MMSLLDISLKLTKITSSYRFNLIISAYKKWLRKGDNVLDVGCGNGIVTKLIYDHFSVKIIGCDIKNYMIYGFPFMRFDGNKLPWKNNHFDVALLNDVLHHIPFHKQENLIYEVRRVARRILIFEAEPTLLGKFADIILNKFHYGDLKVPLTFRSVEDWLKLFKKLGLKSTVIRLRRPFWYPFSHIAFRLEKV